MRFCVWFCQRLDLNFNKKQMSIFIRRQNNLIILFEEQCHKICQCLLLILSKSSLCYCHVVHILLLRTIYKCYLWTEVFYYLPPHSPIKLKYKYKSIPWNLGQFLQSAKIKPISLNQFVSCKIVSLILSAYVGMTQICPFQWYRQNIVNFLLTLAWTNYS